MEVIGLRTPAKETITTQKFLRILEKLGSTSGKLSLSSRDMLWQHCLNCCFNLYNFIVQLEQIFLDPAAPVHLRAEATQPHLRLYKLSCTSPRNKPFFLPRYLPTHADTEVVDHLYTQLRVWKYYVTQAAVRH